MSRLKERARVEAGRRVLAAVVVVVPLAGAVGEARAGELGPYFFSTGQAFVHSTTGQNLTQPGALGATGFNPLELFTDGTFAMLGETFTSASGQYVGLRWRGIIDPSFFPVGGSQVEVNYDIVIGLTGGGGSFTWSLNDDLGGIPLNATGGPLSAASSHITGSMSADVTSPTGLLWFSELDLFWSPAESPPSGITVRVPEFASIDLSVALPEPGSLALLGMGAAGLLARRRRG